MKQTKPIGLVFLMTLLLGFALWLDHCHGANPAQARLNVVNSLRQVGLRVPEARNAITRFSATGTVTTPNPQMQDR